MTIENFIAANNGKYREFNNDNYKNQCVDLIRYYIKDVIGIRDTYKALPGAINAKTIFNQFKDNRYFKKIANNPRDPNQVPPKGAIIFWGYYPFITNSSGHTGIVTSAIKGLNNITVFNQNYPNKKPCLLRNFTYRGIIGWLVPIN